MNLIDLIIDKNDRSQKGRQGILTGSKSLRLQQEDYDRIGKSTLIEEAVDLEREGLIQVQWYDGKSEIVKIQYSIHVLPQLYQRRNREMPERAIETYINQVRSALRHTDKIWIRSCLQEYEKQLEKGNIPVNLKRKNFLECLLGLDLIKDPMYKRIFSAKYLSNSKEFEKSLQKPIITLARKYCPEVEDNMNHSTVLEQIYLEEYSQELLVKGSLNLEIDLQKIETDLFKYGVTLNSQTLKYVKILPKQSIHKVITVENKANFESMPYEKGVLLIFSHGYFSPKEREFLKALENMISCQGVAYYHTGDLDYGGICIFEYIRKRIFPELQPLWMDPSIFIQFKNAGYGEPMKMETLEKLESIHDSKLQPLIDTMVKERWMIEQECFLAWGIIPG